MKKIILLLLFLSITTGSYPQNWSNWSVWGPSNCYAGVSTRFRSQPSSIQGKQKVQVEIRNTYRHAISMNVLVTNNQNENPTYRIDIPSGETYKSGSTEAFLYSGKTFYTRIDKMRFAGDKYGDNYRPCDK